MSSATEKGLLIADMQIVSTTPPNEWRPPYFLFSQFYLLYQQKAQNSMVPDHIAKYNMEIKWSAERNCNILELADTDV